MPLYGGFRLSFHYSKSVGFFPNHRSLRKVAKSASFSQDTVSSTEQVGAVLRSAARVGRCGALGPSFSKL